MEKAFKIRAESDNLELLQNLLREHNLDVGCDWWNYIKEETFFY